MYSGVERYPTSWKDAATKEHEALAGREAQGIGDPLAVRRHPGRMPRHVGVAGVSRVSHRAHDVEQELLALAIELSELRHLPSFHLLAPSWLVAASLAASGRSAPGLRPLLADTLALSRDPTQGNREGASSPPAVSAGPGTARAYNTGL